MAAYAGGEAGGARLRFGDDAAAEGGLDLEPFRERLAEALVRGLAIAEEAGPRVGGDLFGEADRRLSGVGGV